MNPGPCPAGHWALKSNESLVQAPTELQCWMGPINILYGFVWKWLVPLNPMVLLIIIPIKWLFHWEYTLFSDKYIYIYIHTAYHDLHTVEWHIPRFLNENGVINCTSEQWPVSRISPSCYQLHEDEADNSVTAAEDLHAVEFGEHTLRHSRGLIVPPQWGNDLQVQIMAWWTPTTHRVEVFIKICKIYVCTSTFKGVPNEFQKIRFLRGA